MRTEKITLKVDGINKEYIFKPLAWEDLPRLYSLLGKFSSLKEDTDHEHIMKIMDEKTIKDLMDMEFKMFKLSYPEMSDTDIKSIISKNIFELIEVLMKVNLEK